MLPPLLFHRIYSGTLQRRLNFSKALHAALAPQLMQDRNFTEPFAGLREAADRLAGYMGTLGMGRQCGACSANNPGGCCSLEMAGETDAIQILLNLLAGVEVEIADNGGACCFLGDTGCIFAFKPMFCLNYNCDRIISQVGLSRSELEVLTGRLLGKQYEVEKILLERVKNLPASAAG